MEWVARGWAGLVAAVAAGGESFPVKVFRRGGGRLETLTFAWGFPERSDFPEEEP